MQDNLQEEILHLKKEYSIYAPWSDADLFQKIVDGLAEPFREVKIDKVLGLEARGFILGAPVAFVLKSGFIVARKKGKMYPEYLEDKVYSETRIDYSGKEKTLEIEKSEKGIQKGDRVLIVDDWFETGGQGEAAIALVQKAGGIVSGISIMLDDMTQEVRDKFADYNLHALVVKGNFS